MTAPVIPVFNVVPDMEAFRSGFAHLRKGEGQYTWEDVCHVSNWAGVCAFMYMADSYQKRNRVTWRADYIQEKNLYYKQCAPVTIITNDILKKTGVDFTLCFTRKPCQKLLSHTSALAHFQTQKGQRDILFDHSLRQYFPTDGNGILQKPSGKPKTSDLVATNFLSDDIGRNIAYELIETGSASVGDTELENYVDAFVRSVQGMDVRYDPNRHTRCERTDLFILKYNYVRDAEFASWAVLPDEKNGAELFRRYRKIAQTLQYQ